MFPFSISQLVYMVEILYKSNNDGNTTAIDVVGTQGVEQQPTYIGTGIY